jgi:hypothetical protein
MVIRSQGQTTQWPNEKGQKGKQWLSKHYSTTQSTKD